MLLANQMMFGSKNSVCSWWRFGPVATYKFEDIMEEQEEPQMGIQEEEEEERKDNNHPEMLSEDPIEEERNEQRQQQEGEPGEQLEGEGEPGEQLEGEPEEQPQMEEEEKADPPNPNEEFSVESGANDEAISEEAEGNQNQEPSQNQNENQGSIHDEAADADREEQPLEHIDHPHPESIQQQQPVEAEEKAASPMQREPSPEVIRAEEEARALQQEQEERARLAREAALQELKAREAAEKAWQIQQAQDLARAKAQAAHEAQLEKIKIAQNLAYTNKIERLVQSLSQSLTRSRMDEQTLRQANKSLSLELGSSKQVALQLRKRKLQLQMERMRVGKEVEKLRKENGEFREKLAEIEKVGDVLLLQSTVEQLQALTRAQEEEIEQLKTVSTQQPHNYYQEQLTLLESYQTELTNNKEQVSSLNVQLELLQNERAQLQHTKQQLQGESRSQLELIGVLEADKSLLKQEVSGWEQKWQSFEQERAEFKRTRELDQKVSQYESQRFMGEDTEVQLIPIMSDREEKNLLLKEYLKLEAMYEQSKGKQEEAETRLKRLFRDSKIQEANTIRKKDYQDLLSRYRKAKTCLEGAFAKLHALQRVESTASDIREQVDELLQGNESRLCQALIKRTHEQQQLVSDRIHEMEWTDEIITLKKENGKLRESQLRLERDLKNNEKILFLMNDELQTRKRITEEKTKVIEKLIAAGCHHNAEHYQQRIADLQRQLIVREESLSALEVKTVLLIRENQSSLQQINHWRLLYNDIKDRLSQNITLSLAESQRPVPTGRIEAEPIDFCRECERRSLQVNIQLEFREAFVQTETNYELHYKQIKELLMSLKRITKEAEAVPESHKKTIAIITEFKEKYERYIEKYNAKLLELKREKGENDAWRMKVRQEIREEFQDIRELIANDRLAKGLRYAKGLIDYFEKEAEKGGEDEEGKEEIEEENEPEEK